MTDIKYMYIQVRFYTKLVTYYKTGWKISRH